MPDTKQRCAIRLSVVVLANIAVSGPLLIVVVVSVNIASFVSRAREKDRAHTRPSQIPIDRMVIALIETGCQSLMHA